MKTPRITDFDPDAKVPGGKPIVASANVFEFEGEEKLSQVWNRFIFWQKYVLPNLARDGRFFLNRDRLAHDLGF